MPDTLSPHSLADIILEVTSARRIYLAYSGGIDSQVLLHLCSEMPEIKAKLEAVHVHHGLQAQADSWAEHCLATAAQWRIPCRVIRVNAQPAPGESPEEAARHARYNALRPLLQANDLLLLAQHRDDQLETVLIQLFRGSGLHGLSGMPEQAQFGLGRLLRPLLNSSRAEIEAYAAHHQLLWVEDPSNANCNFDRNFLRHAIVPELKRRWPNLDKTVARSAQHCAEALVMSSAQARSLYQLVLGEEDDTLKLGSLRQMTYQQQKLVIRYWFQRLQLRMPSQAVLDQLIKQMIVSVQPGKQTISLASGHQIRCYRETLFCIPEEEPARWESCQWPSGQDFVDITPKQRLQCYCASTGIRKQVWQQAQKTLKFRTGGEKIKLPNRAGRHDLKKLFQETGIPPWQRNTIPLIFLDQCLAAVGSLWIAAEFYTEADDACIKFQLINRMEHRKDHDETWDVD